MIPKEIRMVQVFEHSPFQGFALRPVDRNQLPMNSQSGINDHTFELMCEQGLQENIAGSKSQRYAESRPEIDCRASIKISPIADLIGGEET